MAIAGFNPETGKEKKIPVLLSFLGGNSGEVKVVSKGWGRSKNRGYVFHNVKRLILKVTEASLLRSSREEWEKKEKCWKDWRIVKHARRRAEASLSFIQKGENIRKMPFSLLEKGRVSSAQAGGRVRCKREPAGKLETVVSVPWLGPLL